MSPKPRQNPVEPPSVAASESSARDAAPSSAAEGADGLGARPVPVHSRPRPTPKPRIELCPYCGRESLNTTRCATCGGLFDALSKQATQNAMGPWWLREGDRPLRPGCSYETIKGMVARGTITRETVLRGPTTRQFWMLARRAPGVAHLLGTCHSCQREVSSEAFMCQACGASFTTETDRQHLGLAPIALLPGQAAADRIAAVSAATPSAPTPQSVARGERPGSGLISPPPDAPSFRPAASSAFRASLLDGEDGGLGDLVGVRDPAPVGSVRRRGLSAGGAIVWMLLGVLVASAGIWAALVVAQGDVSRALAALGVERWAGAPSITGGGPTPASGSTESESAVSSLPAAPEGREPRESPPAAIASREPLGTDPRPDPGATPGLPTAPQPRQVDREAQLLLIAERVMAGGTPGLREATGLVDAAERRGVFADDEAAAWRLAIDARAERADLSELP